MPTRVLALIWIASLAGYSPAHAAIYEFTLGGRVTFAALGDVPAGTPVTIRYTADSQDLAPDPGGGLYAAGQGTITFPNFTITTDGTVDPIFRVSLGSGSTVQLLQYLTYQGTWGMSLNFSFPAGTLTSDALPLTLPLANANLARFQVFPILHDWYAGNITSYTAVEIPEPSAALLLLVVPLTRRNRSSANVAR